jgi:hypothetical protein
MERKCPHCHSLALIVAVDTEGNALLLCTDCQQTYMPNPNDPALKEQFDGPSSE